MAPSSDSLMRAEVYCRRVGYIVTSKELATHLEIDQTYAKRLLSRLADQQIIDEYQYNGTHIYIAKRNTWLPIESINEVLCTIIALGLRSDRLIKSKRKLEGEALLAVRQLVSDIIDAIDKHIDNEREEDW